MMSIAAARALMDSCVQPLFVLFDTGDGTFHIGGGEWSAVRGAAMLYRTEAEGQAALEECDNGELYRDRFVVLPVSP